MMKAMFFDLDNTLYDAQQYFLGAFNNISKYISLKYNIPKQEVHKALVELWSEKTSMYPHLLDDLLGLFHIDQDSTKVIVKIFNEYTGKLEPYPDVFPVLQMLRQTGYKLGIITDGDVERQKRKIESLKFEPLFDVIIYAKETESKPSSLPFLASLEKLKANATDVFYVADNPLIDFKGAKEAGLKTIRILRGEFTKVPRNEYIDFEIEKLEELLEIINKWEKALQL